MKRMTIFIMALLLGACGPSPDQIARAVQETMDSWTPVPSQTAMPSYTPAPTLAVEVTRLVTREVTPASTSTPVFTATESLTPTLTSIPTATRDPLSSDKGPGIYLVGVDIAPGLWRSTPGISDDSCYWEVTSRTGDLQKNNLGASGMTMYLARSDFQVTMKPACGTWTYLGPP
jgi:hypothetical protein